MEQEVYVDLYFLINFAMDFLCFFLTSRLLSIKESLPRTLAASAVGALYACLSLFWGLEGLISLSADIGACVIMSAIAFCRRGELRRLPVNSLVYTAVSIVLGGFMTALFSFFNRIGLDRLLGSEKDADGISVWLFGLLALISGVLAMLGGKFFKKKSARTVCRVRLCKGKKTVELKALCDSGNLLRDPISARPCIVVELDSVRELFARKTLRAIEKGSEALFEGEDAARVRIVPVKTVSGDGMMYAFRLDRVELDFGGGWLEADALAAISTVSINADGASALVPGELNVGRK